MSGTSALLTHFDLCLIGLTEPRLVCRKFNSLCQIQITSPDKIQHIMLYKCSKFNSVYTIISKLLFLCVCVCVCVCVSEGRVG